MNDYPLSPMTLADHLREETAGELSPIQAELKRASDENRRRDVERWRYRACAKVLAEFRLLGFTGFTCRSVDGEMVFEPVGVVPSYLAAREGT